MKKKALIIGATGLVGKELVHLLLEENTYEEVRVLIRRELPIGSKKLKQLVIDDFEMLSAYKEYFQVDDLYCCLGTTIKKAGSQGKMIKIDVEYPLECAKLGLEMGVKQFLVITAMGANRNSSIFYSRIKGILEEKLATIPFRSIHILRPSLLLGSRDEFRLGEKLSSYLLPVLHFFMQGSLKKYRAIQARNVAQAMYHLAQSNYKGVHVHTTDELEKLAKKSY